jgi:hypothetical protein
MNTRGGKKKKAFFSYVKLTARVLGARRTKCCHVPISKHTCMNHAEFAGGNQQ